jgi:cell division protein FtsZ
MGARGILVNVTAGMDMSIGEFEEVGNTIKEFASENATVVVGTVIDPTMRDELRVTVVATGLGLPMTQQKEAPMKLVERNKDGEVDYRDYEQPTIKRKRAVGDVLPITSQEDLDYLDIPAFLRRQAD